MYLFAYGTLKHGYGWNKILLQHEARYHGWAYIDDIGLYGWGRCPAAFMREGSRAWGEIYAVTPEILGRLDTLEAMYTRTLMTATIIEGSIKLNPLRAWIYISKMEPTGGAWIENGVFE